MDANRRTPAMSAADPFAGPEFPGYANVRDGAGEAEPIDTDPVAAGINRRSFLALSAGFSAAVLAGCRRPELQILPFSAIPEEFQGHLSPGRPTFYATSFPRPGGSLPILVESHDGRPTKIEGNPQHPASGGSTDVFAQGSIFDLYSPDRVMSDRIPGVMEKGTPRRWGDFDRFARNLAQRLTDTQGEGLAILTEQVPAPSLRLIRDHLRRALPKAAWYTYEPTDATELLKGAEIAFGQKLIARYDFARLNRVLALDCDFLGTGPDVVEYSRAFASRRKVEDPAQAAKMNRLYVVESTYTITGTMADHRLRLPASQIGDYLLALARELKSTHGRPLPELPTAAATPPVPSADLWVKAVAKDLVENAPASAVLVGPRQPAWVHALAHAVNAALGSTSPRLRKDAANTKDAPDTAPAVSFVPAPPEATEPGLPELVAAITAGTVRTLVIVGGNPILNAPADLTFRTALEKVPTKIRLGLFYDQTSEACDWHLPLAHYLESWGDTETSDGTLCCIQPLIAPLNGSRPANASELEPPPRGGRTAFEVLALLTAFPNPADRRPVANFEAARQAALAAARQVFSDRSGIPLTDPSFDTEFNRYKQLGFLPRSKAKSAPPPEAKVDAGRVSAALAGHKPAPAPTADALEITFHPSYALFDGRFAMNPWLQEFPDPITKIVWDNAAVLSPKTAAEFGVGYGDVVRLSVNGNSVEIPVYVLPGQADYSVALAYGQSGEMRISHVPDGGGTNVFPLRTTTALHTATGVKLTKLGRRADLVVTQEHGVIPEGRDIIRDLPAKELGHTPSHGHGHGSHGHDHDHKHGDGSSSSGVDGHHGPTIGLPPDGHLSEDDLRRQFQGGYGNPQHARGPARDKQERFPLDLARPELLDSQFQWGMVIDLSACTGCSACLIACQAENNIPVVGKQEVKRNREMHWIRIDRYFSSDGKTADVEPTIVSQPIACVHCEAAPCEQVCPVNAAVHSNEGLNLQVYNRCIGTRYCANACPYKARRFNWFDFNKRQLDELRTPTPFATGGASLTQNLLPETLRMQKNPDVSVRMRGVMEKCTYCVQRIERGKAGAKIAAAKAAWGIDGNTPSPYRKPADPKTAGYDLDDRGRVIVPDGLIVTACQAACPSQAIVFGNVLDPNSAVSKAKKRAGEYLLLGELNTKPRTSFLPRLRNPNPEFAAAKA